MTGGPDPLRRAAWNLLHVARNTGVVFGTPLGRLVAAVFLDLTFGAAALVCGHGAVGIAGRRV